MKDMGHRTWWIVGGIVAVGAILRFFQAGNFDVYRDDALNAFRALGWFDYMGTDGFQTSPVQWFAQVPSWAHLSFHDAPPLVFWIQNVFFTFFGDGVFVLRLPFILAGLLLAIWIFFALKRTHSVLAGVIGSIAFALSSYAVWTSLSGYLEGIQYLFVAGTVFFFATFFKTGKYKSFLFGSFFLGLSLLSKYTAVFLLPVLVAYVLIFRRDLLTVPAFWKQVGFGVAIVLLVLSPVIIYNYSTYEARGHFDAALSSMLGMQPEDFKGIAGRAETIEGGKIFTHAGELVGTLYETSSLPFLILFVISFLFVAYRSVSQKGGELERMITLSVVFLGVLFLFLPPEPRFLSLFIPFMALSIGIAGSVVLAKERLRMGAGVLLGLVLITEGLYALNTNVLQKPVGEAPLFYSSHRLYNRGFVDLEAYLREEIYTQLPARKTVVNFSDQVVGPKDIKGRPVVLYDDSVEWLAWFWHILRYPTYYKVPMVSTEMLIAMDDASQFVQDAAVLSGKEVYFVRAVDSIVLDPLNDERPEKLEYLSDIDTQFEALSIPYEEVKNQSGVVVFRVYLLKDSSTSYLERIDL